MSYFTTTIISLIFLCAFFAIYFDRLFYKILKQKYPNEWESLDLMQDFSLKRWFVNGKVERDYLKKNEYEKLNDQSLNKIAKYQKRFNFFGRCFSAIFLFSILFLIFYSIVY